MQQNSVKDLNRKNFQLNSRIKVVEKDLNKLLESKSRQINNKNAVRILDTKIKEKQSELKSLKDAEKQVQGEQKSRKDTKKHCYF